MNPTSTVPSAPTQAPARARSVSAPRADHRPQSPSLLLRDRDESDPWRRAVELAQRGRMVLDGAAADLEAAEAALGAFHDTTWYFRNAWYEARRSWERLRAELGGAALTKALNELSLVALPLPESRQASASADRSTRAASAPSAWLITIAGQTYCARRVAATDLAPVVWRVTRLAAPLENGPYYVCRLADRSTQCDCAEWTYHIAGNDERHGDHCKHLAALAALGWI